MGGDRSVPKIHGIIHSLGVTYYTPTRALLTSQAGPAAQGVSSFAEQASGISDDVRAVQHLTNVQEDANRIELFDDSKPDPKGYRIRFFPTSDVHLADEWFANDLEVLSKEEAPEKLRNR